jgi:predicted CoA-binding protein
MVSDEELKSILESNRSIAVVGMSRKTDKPAGRIPRRLLTWGYDVVPVNPNADSIIGRKCYPSLDDIPGDVQVDLVDVFRPSEEAADVVRTAVRRKERHGDVKVVWLQEGIVSEEAEELAQEAGLTFVQDRCIYKEYVRLVGE